MTKTEKQKIGDIGEDIACNFLEKRGFSVLERNYRKKWGEIDIIAQRGSEIHFIEVKTISRNEQQSYESEALQNVHSNKIRKLERTILTYLLEKSIPETKLWQLDVVSVVLDMQTKTARCSIIECIS